jgi:hypothetical protein
MSSLPNNRSADAQTSEPAIKLVFSDDVIATLADMLAERLHRGSAAPEFTSDLEVAAASIGMTRDPFQKLGRRVPKLRYSDQAGVWHLPTLRAWALAGFPDDWSPPASIESAIPSPPQRRRR